MQLEFLQRLLGRLRRDRYPSPEALFARPERGGELSFEAGANPPGIDAALLSDPLYAIWKRLTVREQQVAALTCQNFTNGEIAMQLCLSVETIRDHLRNANRKYNVQGKDELRRLLAHWDFSEWAEQRPLRWARSCKRETPTEW